MSIDDWACIGFGVNLLVLIVTWGLWWMDRMIPEDFIPPWDNM